MYIDNSFGTDENRNFDIIKVMEGVHKKLCGQSVNNKSNVKRRKENDKKRRAH